MPTDGFTEQQKQEWVKWLEMFSPIAFLESFLRTSHGAISTCQYCAEEIRLDILEGGGVADWKTTDGDYGCPYSPETTADGTGSHLPEGVKRQA